MAERIGWNQYEVALLIDACEKINTGVSSKKAIVHSLSKQLRNLATFNGNAIDEVFRNENGIALQMTKMNYLLTDGIDGLPGASKFFGEMVAIWKDNESLFKKILLEAKSQVQTSQTERADKVLFKKFVDKSLLNAGLTIPKDSAIELCDQLEVTLSKGDNCDITIIIDGNAFNARLTNVNFSDKYANVTTYQIRYSRGSEICKKLNCIFSYTADLIANNAFSDRRECVEIIAQGPKTIKFVCETIDNMKSKTEASNMNDAKSSFALWMRNKQKLKSSISSIIFALDEGSEYAMKHGVSKKSFWDISEAKEFDFICRKLLGMRLFRVMHRKAALVLDKAYVHYKEFLALPKEDAAPITDRKQPFGNEDAPALSKPCPNGAVSEVMFSEWMKSKGMADTTTRSYISSLHSAEAFADEHGIENVKLTTDNAAAISSIEKLLANKEFIQFNQEQHNRFSAAFRKLRDFISETERHEALRTSDIELEVKNSTLYQKLYSISKVYDDPQGMSAEHILSLLGMSIPKEEVTEFLDRVSWATKAKNSVYSFSKTPVKKMADNEELSDFDKDQFVKVLIQRYQNGMQFDSIDLENFRDTYFDLFDKKLAYSDEELIQRIKQCGIFYKDRLFPAEGIIDNATKEKLFSYIDNTFAAGNKVLYYKSIYEDLSDAFAYCFSLSDEKMLQAFIEFAAAKGKYYFYSNYMSLEKDVKLNPLKEITDYMLSAGKPLSYEEIYAGLSHISRNVIYREIQINSCFLRNEKEHYFHIDIFEFSTEDAIQISSLLNQEIDENGYAIWSRVFLEIQEQMPIFLENNLYLSALGIRNALSRHMSNQYNFESEVISTHDKCLSMADVYSLYGKHHAPFSDDDLYSFSKEVGSVIYFGSLAEETVRVSRKLFVAKDKVTFDTDAVDAALGTYLSSGYILVRDVDSFLVFPNVGYEWNEFLLESYLRSYSKKFALINNGSSLNNVAGAVVKKDGEYTQFLDICAHALAESGVELKKEPALNYLAEINLITRRSYRELDSALLKARQIRNRKG